PDGDGAVVAGDGEPSIVRTPGQPINCAGFLRQRIKLPACLELPDFHAQHRRRGESELGTVRAQAKVIYPPPVTFPSLRWEGGNCFSLGNVPGENLAVATHD